MLAVAGSPYVGLVPYTEEQARFFFGREVDRDLICANLLAARLTILYGPSGAGKSSVLQASVIPNLRARPLQLVVDLSKWHTNPLTSLQEALTREVERAGLSEQVARSGLDLLEKPESPGGKTELELFLDAVGAATSKKVALIFDQFEEHFLYVEADSGPVSFDAQLARLVNRPESPVGVLISVRDDALSTLDRFEGRIPGLFDNYLRLEHLDRSSARAAIVRPMEAWNAEQLEAERVAIEPGLDETIVDQISKGRVSLGGTLRGAGLPEATDKDRVDASLLQLILTRLWEEEMAMKSRVLRASTLRALGGPEKIVLSHLDRLMARLEPEQREISARMFHFLVTPSGNKIAHTATDLADYTELPPPQVAQVVERLTLPDMHVLRVVVDGPAGVSHVRYEIFHDVLGPAVLDWRARYTRRYGVARRSIQLVWGALLLLLLSIAIDRICLFQGGVAETLRLLARATSLLVFHYVALLQVYAWFFRYLRLTTMSLSAHAYSVNVGGLLGILIMLYWYFATSWPDGPVSRDLAMLRADRFIYYQVTLVYTVFVGIAVFVIMERVGQLTHRLFRGFDIGFYGVYAFASAGLVLLMILTVQGGLGKWISFP